MSALKSLSHFEDRKKLSNINLNMKKETFLHSIITNIVFSTLVDRMTQKNTQVVVQRHEKISLLLATR